MGSLTSTGTNEAEAVGLYEEHCRLVLVNTTARHRKFIVSSGNAVIVTRPYLSSNVRKLKSYRDRDVHLDRQFIFHRGANISDGYHAEIIADESGVFIVPDKWRMGRNDAAVTSLNGTRIRTTEILREGDIIEFGDKEEAELDSGRNKWSVLKIEPILVSTLQDVWSGYEEFLQQARLSRTAAVISPVDSRNTPIQRNPVIRTIMLILLGLALGWLGYLTYPRLAYLIL